MTRFSFFPKLSSNSLTILRKRYLLQDENGNSIESPTQLFERVALAVAEPEGKKKKMEWAEKFYTLMASKRFMPNSPTLMNAGRSEGQLAACFVLPVGDSLDSIFQTLKYAAKIHQSGGGTGFSFSQLRPRGSLVKSTHGVASGPVSFMKIFDVATETIKQGGARRGANMAILRVDHPDILEFVESKLDSGVMTNFNISVGITDAFMDAVKHGSEFELKGVKSSVRKVHARELFDRMVQCAWKCGDPGLVFLDRINLFNPTPQEGEMESTNPCGEQPLLPYESCNLGSLNLGMYFDGRGSFHWELFERDIETAVRFLDNVVEVNHYPVAACKKITLKNRKIGLGVMGFADLLLMMEVPYSSPEALDWGEKIMSFLDRKAKHVSAELALERGSFPNWKGSLWHRLGYPPLRNATVSTVAPTGTISMIAGASSGIEPLFSGVFYRNVLDGERLVEVHPVVERLLLSHGISLHSITDEEISKHLGEIWSPSHAVPVDVHIKMQAAFQRHSDSAVSKTINLPEDAPVEAVAQAYHLAYRQGCKGITVYRNRSRPTQVLELTAQMAGGEEECPTC